jgi:hypothetical protein
MGNFLHQSVRNSIDDSAAEFCNNCFIYTWNPAFLKFCRMRISTLDAVCPDKNPALDGSVTHAHGQSISPQTQHLPDVAMFCHLKS